MSVQKMAIRKLRRVMLDLVRRFAGSRRGSIAVATALGAPVVFAIAGVAMDYFMMVHIKGQLQIAADSAAIAAVKELGLSGVTDQQVTSVAESFVYTNLGELSENGITEGTLGIDVKITKEERIVEVAITQEWTPFFMQFVNSNVTPIRARAQAKTMGQRLACVLGLSELAPPGVHLYSSASLVADGCDVYSNTETLGLIVNDDATLKADLICVSGAYKAHGASAVEPDPITDCPKFDDPLASRQAPKVGGCDHFAMKVINQNKTLDPGTYCGGLTILGKSKVTLNPGVYIIHNGLLKVSGTASMTGENVGFYLSGIQTLMFLDSGTTIDLTAPKDGPLAGILFFEDRKALPLRIHRIGSNNARNLVGTIYLPLGILFIDANAPVADNSAYTALVVRSLQLSEGPKLVLHSDYKSTDIPVPDGLIGGQAVLIR